MYAERKISENSSVSVAAMMSSSICSLNMEFVLTTSGLFILTDLTNIWILSFLKGEWEGYVL